jgi:hypothetical protein
MECQSRRDLDRLPPAARAEVLHVLLQPDFERGRFAVRTKASTTTVRMLTTHHPSGRVLVPDSEPAAPITIEQR